MMPAMSPRILFIGAGAIGSYLGAFLSRSGNDVTLVDPWPEQVEAIRARGISVTGPHEPFEAKPTALHVHEAQRLAADFDVAFVAMKAYDTAWATHMALPRLGPAVSVATIGTASVVIGRRTRSRFKRPPAKSLVGRPLFAKRDRGFESSSLQRRVCKPSVPRNLNSVSA